MVRSCSAINCSQRNAPNTSFFTFPINNLSLCEKWVRAMKRYQWKPTKYSLLCSKHFIPSDYESYCKKKLKPEAVPSLFKFHVLFPLSSVENQTNRNPLGKQNEINLEDHSYCKKQDEISLADHLYARKQDETSQSDHLYARKQDDIILEDHLYAREENENNLVHSYFKKWDEINFDHFYARRENLIN